VQLDVLVAAGRRRPGVLQLARRPDATVRCDLLRFASYLYRRLGRHLHVQLRPLIAVRESTDSLRCRRFPTHSHSTTIERIPSEPRRDANERAMVRNNRMTAVRNPESLRRYPWAFAVAVSVGACATSTSSRDAAQPDVSTVAVTIGPGGGTVAASGASLLIPPGALADEVIITIANVGTAPPPYVGFSPRFRFGPSGLHFRTPIVVAIAYEGDPGLASLYWSRDSGPGFDRAAARPVGRVMTADVDHFSEGFVGYESATPTPDVAVPDSGVDVQDEIGFDVRSDSTPDALTDNSIEVRDGVSTMDVVDAADGPLMDTPDAPSDILFTDAPAPGARLISPTSGARTNRRPLLRWELPSGADGARVEICARRDCAAGVEQSFVVPGTSGVPSTDLAFGRHYWSVTPLRAGAAVGPAIVNRWAIRVARPSAPRLSTAGQSAWRGSSRHRSRTRSAPRWMSTVTDLPMSPLEPVRHRVRRWAQDTSQSITVRDPPSDRRLRQSSPTRTVSRRASARSSRPLET